MEIWKDVIGYEGKYKVSNQGRMESFFKGKWRMMNPFLGMGYPRVRLGDGKGVIKNQTVHRLVAEAFIRPIEKGMQVNHIDGNKQNNNVENLEIVTPRENILHGINVLKNRLISVVMLDKETNEVIAEFQSIKEASLKTGIYDTGISAAYRGNRKTAGGYVWKKKK